MPSFADRFPCGEKQRLSNMKLHLISKFLFFKYSGRLWDYTFFPIPVFWKMLHLRNKDKQRTVFLKKNQQKKSFKKKIVCLNFDTKLHQNKLDTFVVQWGKMLQSKIILCTLFHNFTWNSFASDWSLKFFQGIGSLELFRKCQADCRVYFSCLTKGGKRIAFSGNGDWLYFCH